jgi:hypothetical protein
MPALYNFFGNKTFAVPATSGNYAPERLTFCPTAGVGPLPLLGVTALLESGPAGTVLELWLLKFGGTPATDADWVYSGKSITGGGETWPLASFPGAQLRCKSGGTSGSAVVTASAD